MIQLKYRMFYPQPNSRKSLSYLYNANKPWMLAKWVVVNDFLIPENMYLDTNEWYLFAQVEPWTADVTELTDDLANHTWLNDTEVLSVADAKTWIDANTDNTKLIKESDWVYYYLSTDIEWVETKVYINVN